MKQIITIFFLCTLSGFSFAQTGRSRMIGLAECIRTAVANNPAVQRNEIEAEASQVILKQSRLNMLPNLNAGYTTGVNQGRSIDPFTNSYINQQYSFASPSFGSSVPLFNGFALFNTIRRNALRYDADRLRIQQSKDELTLNVILAYLQLLTNKEQLALATSQQVSTQKQLDRLTILHEQQAVAPGEYYDLKGISANDKLGVVNAMNAVENSKIALSKLMNLPYSKDLDPEPLNAEQLYEDTSLTAAIIYQIALKNLAMVRVADMQKKVADMDVKISRSGFYPSVFLNAGLNSNYSGAAGIKYKEQINNNLNTSVYAGVSIPLFNSLRTRNTIRLAKLDLETAELDARTARIQLQQLIDEAYFNMQFSKDRYTVSTQQAEDFRESFQRADAKFTLGAGTVVEYIISRNNYDKANINVINARYDLIFRMRILDYYQGKLNP